VTLCRGVVPVAKIVPLTPPRKARPAVGQPTAEPFPIPHDAFAPLTERELMDWGIR
jgi:antitoxin (DNA-binding transcriptional repressor) of toxin-antitoxin stability system